MGFLAPWFLGGLAALGVPVFVHLLRRQNATPRPVSSLMFFERGTQSSTRHRRLRYLVLFALRCAMVLLVAAAFANPFLRRTTTGADSRLLMVVLDNSFSMRAGTRFADAKRQALEVLASKPPGQKAQVLSLGAKLEVLTRAISDEAQLRAAVESIAPTDGHASFGELGQAIRTMSDTANGPIEVQLFSDMQRTAMPANFADAVLPSNVKLALHGVASGSTPANWTVEGVDAPAALSDPKDPKRSRVQAVIAGFATPPAAKRVALLVNGKTIQTREVNVPANGRASVEFAPLEVAYGSNRCEVRIEGGDGFPEDDRSLFAVRRSDPERVLLVHGADTRSSLYFGSALSAASQGSFVLQSVSAEQATDLDPAKYAFVVLSDVPALPAIFEHALSQYVAKGGGVLLALGTAAAHQAQIPLWGGGVEGTHDYAHMGEIERAGQLDFSHPALEQEAQSAADNGGWAEVRVFYAVVVGEAGARVAARLMDGTPLLLDKPLGEGHVVLLASGLENLTNDLPLHPVFVAFVDRMARYLSGGERLSGARVVDSFVQLRTAAEPAGAIASVEVSDPEGHRPLSLAEARTAKSFRFGKAGFYEIRFADGRNAVVGVNPDRRESDLEPLAKDVQDLWSGSSHTAARQAAGSEPVERNNRLVSLWWYVMLLGLIVALAETALASGYLGTQREEV